MKVFKRLAAVISAVVIAVSATASMAVTAGADSIADTAKAISSGKSVTTTLKLGKPGDYKISVTNSGKLVINLDANMNSMLVYLYDSDGQWQDSTDIKETSGSIFQSNEICTRCYWNSTIEKCKGSITYLVTKGTYYLRFKNTSNSLDENGSGKLNFTATYPSTTSKAKFKYLTLNLSRGYAISLGADTTGSAEVTWKSSKPSVATVSSTGKVTAKSTGTTIISAKCGKTTKKIKIIVT